MISCTPLAGGLKRFFSGLVVLGMFLAADDSRGQGTLSPVPVPAPIESTVVAFDPNSVYRDMSLAVRTRPSLHGAWLWVEADSSAGAGKRLTFRRILDRGRARQQRAELDALVKSWIPAGIGYTLPPAEKDELYPFSELIDQLQNAVESQSRLGGCLVTGLFLTQTPQRAEPGQLELVLVGQVADERHRTQIALLAEEILSRDKTWYKETETTGSWLRANMSFEDPESKKPALALVHPSSARGATHFDDGLKYFRAGRSQEAAAAFHLATIQAPRSVTYRYWRVVAEISSGNRDAAQSHLNAAVKAFQIDPSAPSQEYRLAMRSLERIQGPVRQQLAEMERSALAESTRSAKR